MYYRCLNLLKYYKQKFLQTPRYLLTKRVRKYLNENALPLEPEEFKKIKKFLRHNLIEVFNYPFVIQYTFRRNKIYEDKDKCLPYLIHSGKRIYFKRGLPHKQINHLFNSLNQEQDPNSPHYYHFEKINLTPDTIIADIGVAEGNFSVDLVDQVKEIHLFEYDEGWIEALKATFEPWKDKVHIVKSFVSDKTSEDNLSLDDYFRDKPAPDILKIDVEGAEHKVLQGARQLLEKKKISDLLVCTYHQKGDAEQLSGLLEKYQYKITFSKGYMLFLGENDKQPPYDFRKGLLHARMS